MRFSAGGVRLSRSLTFVAAPQSLHSVSVQSHTRKLAEALANVKVAERADLEEGHAVLGSVEFRFAFSDLPFERQV